MATKRITFTCPEDILGELQANADINKVSLSEEICNTLDRLRQQEVLTIMANAFLARNTAATDTKLEEQTVALEVAAKNTKLAVVSALTAQTKLLTDLINDKITPVGVVLLDNFAEGILNAVDDDDFIDWNDDLYATAIRLVNRYVTLLHQHNYTINDSNRECLATAIGDATIKLA